MFGYVAEQKVLYKHVVKVGFRLCQTETANNAQHIKIRSPTTTPINDYNKK